jgi:hypothetical protein
LWRAYGWGGPGAVVGAGRFVSLVPRRLNDGAQRATVYTGDQIAYSCCHDFQVSLAAVYRLLVGRELSSSPQRPD